MKSIFFKLMTVQLLCAGLATAILWKLSDRSFKESMSSSFVTNGQTVAESIAYSVERHLASHDLTSVQSALDASLKIPDVVWAYVTAPDGSVLADTFVPNFPDSLPRTGSGKGWLSIRMPGTNAPVAIFTHPVLTGIFGAVHVGFSQQKLLASMNRMKLLLLTTVAIVIFLLTAIVGLVMRSILSPIRALTSATSALTKDLAGDFKALPVSSSDELGVLTASFNRMIFERQEHRHNLEHRVLERTADLLTANQDLAANQRDMQLILNNVEEGLVTINLDGRMSSETSRAVKEWFGAPVAGDKFAAWIGQRDAGFGDWFDLALESLKEGMLPAEVALSQLPARLRDGEKTYSVHYQLITNAYDRPDQISDASGAIPRVAPVSGETAPEKILIIIADITEILSKDAAERHQGELLLLFQHMMRDKTGFLEFLAEADDIMGSLKAGRYASLDQLKRLVHTLKGNAAIFGMRRVSDVCHELENEIAEQGEVPTRIETAPLDQAWGQIRADIEKLIGEARHSSIEIDDYEYEVILKALRDGVAVSTVAQMMESWRLEPTEKLLERIGQQIKGLAERMGKSNVSVLIEPNDLRFNSERFAPFWAEFVHVLRNAVDHGIEDREARQRGSKPEQSVIRVATAIDGDRFVVTVEDDGPGVDWERLRMKAGELAGGISAIEDSVTLICLPGLSSKDTVTELSGRGVGMDAVAKACKALGGMIEVKSERGVGTRIEFAFPKDQGIYEGHAAILQLATVLVPPPAKLRSGVAKHVQPV